MTDLADVLPLPLLGEMLDGGYVRRQTHPTLPLAILNYTEKTAYDGVWNEVTRVCRGLIYQPSVFPRGGRVVARPFPKFFNLGQDGAPEIDLDAPALVTDKLDGSLGILYPTGAGDSYLTADGRDRYAVATRGSFTSEQALWATDWFRRYGDPSFFDPSLTYLFEILVGWNRIVCDYDWDGLALLAILDTATGYPRDLPEDPRLLQARSPRDDAREHVDASEEGLEDVPLLQEGEPEARRRTSPRAQGGVSAGVGEGERRATARTSPGVEVEDPGRAGRGEEREVVPGLRWDVPARVHGLRPREGDEGLQRGAGEDDQADGGRDREVRTGVRELPPNQDAFRIVDRFPYVTLADALRAEPRPNAEGLVVYLPETGERVKIKQDDYVALHRILTGTNARNVWEVVAVQACAQYVTDPKQWGSYLRVDPARAEQVLELGDEWLAGVPDEFYGWVEQTSTEAEEGALWHVSRAAALIAEAKAIAERRTRYEFVFASGHPAVQEIMRLADGREEERGHLVMRCWLAARPEPTAPFARSEAVA